MLLRRMQNRFIKKMFFFAKIFISAVAVVIGSGILFGDIFYWSNNDYWGHLYAFLSAFALWFGVGAFMIDKIKIIAKLLLITHAVSTIMVWSLNGQEPGLTILLISIDLTLFSLILKLNRKQPGTDHE